jgi:uncharacterized protein (DUF2267 family)
MSPVYSVQDFLGRIQQAARLESKDDALRVAEAVSMALKEIVPSLEEEGDFLAEDLEDAWAQNPLIAWLEHLEQDETQTDLADVLERLEEEEDYLLSVSTPRKAVEAVFAATKSYLSDDEVRDLALELPPNLKALWLSVKRA